MDHPNIAKVLDAGTTESGRPYFVMELVKGVPITEYCDEHQLTPQRAAGAVRPGLPGRPARPPEGHHPPRPQAVERPGHPARRQAGAQGHRLRRGQGDRPAADRADACSPRSAQIVGTPEYMSPGAGRAQQPRHRHPHRHLFAGRAALRAADRHDAVRARSGCTRRPSTRCCGIIREEEPPQAEHAAEHVARPLPIDRRQPQHRAGQADAVWCAASSTGS